MKFREETPVTILHIEDNPADARLTQEAFAEEGIRDHVHIAQNGLEGMDFLRQAGRFSNAPRPDLILLDLNMPSKGGHEVLAEIKADPDLGRIPVIVVSDSHTDADILKAYDLRANCYIVKPLDFARFLEVVGAIKEFWMGIVQLPPHQGKG